MRRILAAVLILAGCDQGSGSLPTAASVSQAGWVSLDLADGTTASLAEPDARTLADARWRTTHMLFRRVEAGPLPASDDGLPEGGEAEDQAGTTASGTAFVAVYELTEGQWNRLRGLDGGGALPATGVAPDELAVCAAARSAAPFTLAIPDAGLWAYACAAGSSALFTWGNGTAEDAAATYAVHQPADGSAPPRAPAAVGSLTANRLGLYDMHGNVWEIVRTADGYAASGGAWDSPVLQCRTANRVAIPGDLVHPAVGARLVLRP